VERGNSVLVIEHNMDVIKCADYIIDMGPEGGDRGGAVVAKGTPEEIASEPASYTGAFLKQYLNQGAGEPVVSGKRQKAAVAPGKGGRAKG